MFQLNSWVRGMLVLTFTVLSLSSLQGGEYLDCRDTNFQCIKQGINQTGEQWSRYCSESVQAPKTLIEYNYLVAAAYLPMVLGLTIRAATQSRATQPKALNGVSPVKGALRMAIASMLLTGACYAMISHTSDNTPEMYAVMALWGLGNFATGYTGL